MAQVAPTADAAAPPPATGPSDQVMLDPAASGIFGGAQTHLVRQKARILEMFGCELNNKYRVAAPAPGTWNPEEWNDKVFFDSPQVMAMKEDSSCFARYCIGPCRALKVNVAAGQVYPGKEDPNVQVIMQMDRPMRIPILCCCKEFCAQEMSLYNKPQQGGLNPGDRVGRVVHDFRCIDQMFCMKNWWRVESGPEENPRHEYDIVDDQCCNANMMAPNCICKVREFKVLAPGAPADSEPLGKIKNYFLCNIKRLCIPGVDQYAIEYPANATPEQKALLMTALTLFEFALFEHAENEAE